MIPADQSRGRRWLRLVRWLTWLDVTLLLILVSSSVADERLLVQVIGWLHGGIFIVLLTLVGVAAAIGLWGWWFPIVILLTGGTIGALVGERLLSRRLTNDG